MEKSKIRRLWEQQPPDNSIVEFMILIIVMLRNNIIHIIMNDYVKESHFPPWLFFWDLFLWCYSDVILIATTFVFHYNWKNRNSISSKRLIIKIVNKHETHSRLEEFPSSCIPQNIREKTRSRNGNITAWKSSGTFTMKARTEEKSRTLFQRWGATSVILQWRKGGNAKGMPTTSRIFWRSFSRVFWALLTLQTFSRTSRQMLRLLWSSSHLSAVCNRPLTVLRNGGGDIAVVVRKYQFFHRQSITIKWKCGLTVERAWAPKSSLWTSSSATHDSAKAPCKREERSVKACCNARRRSLFRQHYRYDSLC